MLDGIELLTFTEAAEESRSISPTSTEGSLSDPTNSLFQAAVMCEAYLALTLLPLRVGKGLPNPEGVTFSSADQA